MVEAAAQPRYFYSDALAVAWMAKHFGMRFEGCDHGAYAHVLLHPNADPDSFPPDDNRYGIHPDSLHLLELREGGIVTPIYGHRPKQVRPWDIHEIRNRTRPGFKRGCQVIQRDGIPFMWPESEP